MDQPVQVFTFERPKASDTITIKDATRGETPVYAVQLSNSKPNLRISHVQPPAPASAPGYSYAHPGGNHYAYGQAPGNAYEPSYTSTAPGYGTGYGHGYTAPPPPAPAIGFVVLHSSTSKIDISVHGQDILLKRDHPFAGHSFKTRVGTFEWKEVDSSWSTKFKLIDKSNKAVLARWEKKKEKDGNKRPSLFSTSSKVVNYFSLYVQADAYLLDLIIVSGMAAVEYRRRSDKEWDEVGQEIGENAFG